MRTVQNFEETLFVFVLLLLHVDLEVLADDWVAERCREYPEQRMPCMVVLIHHTASISISSMGMSIASHLDFADTARVARLAQPVLLMVVSILLLRLLRRLLLRLQVHMLRGVWWQWLLMP